LKDKKISLHKKLTISLCKPQKMAWVLVDII